MNLRIVLHLLKTDWHRLRWLILACWLLLLFAAWPALSFSPEKFEMPLSLGSRGWSDSELVGILEKHGAIPVVRNWIFLTFGWIATGAVLLVAGSLGFHSRMWSDAKPVRKLESAAAKGSGLLLFLIIPLSVVSIAIPLVHGFSLSDALAAGWTIAMANLPKLAGVMLFGAICGSWWTWVAGMFAIAVSFQILPFLLRISPGPSWFGSLLNTGPLTPHLLVPLWVAAAVVALLVIFIPRQLAHAKKVATVILLVLLACHFARPRPPLPQMQQASLPDWSGQVRAEVKNDRLQGSIGRSSYGRGAFTNSSTSVGSPVLSMLMSLEVTGLPEGCFATWTPGAKSELLSGNQVISETPKSNPWEPMYHSLPDWKALTAAVAPERSELKWDGPSSLSDSALLAETFTPIELGSHADASLRMTLHGKIFRFEKLIDVPLGDPVQIKRKDMEIHIRRLDVEDRMPIADICTVMRSSGPEIPDEIPMLDWTPVIYFPSLGMARIAWTSHQGRMSLSPGILAMRYFYITGQISNGSRDLEGYDNARFMLLKRVNLAKTEEEIHTKPLPLQLTLEWGDPKVRDSFDPPPFEERPDPATASFQEFEKWMIASYSWSDQSGWESRNMADFVPRYLDRLLIRSSNTQPSSIPEGTAIALACPESRKGEVISALLEQNVKPDGNWIPDVLIRRGWVEDAKPQILQMATAGGIKEAPFSQIMVAMLEDPRTYPALLEQEPWFDIYEKIRQLPGIEPRLTEVLLKNYRGLANRRFPVSGLDYRISFYYAPAAHGIPEAFSDLLSLWKQLSDEDKRRFAEQMRKVVLIPGEPEDWKQVIGTLAAGEPADFHYDPLARLWIPISPESP
ncbi:hypothetical protein [Luteolibacter luteus]|uniref:Uncharacterized protein n=1 Tax=Luteolibacter luteus TaxID=2728835 RepID=A0A858RL73_9BACT|nr:hypothetical protein [Luteolibacter luteus]QJE97592.1 hypothetical protein HHL09_18000 [Luteolibacter luteus]